MLERVISLVKSVVKSELDRITYRRINTISVKYFSDIQNWGDVLIVELIERITGVKVISCPLGNRTHILGIGSILVTANQNSIVWGSGFLTPTQKTKGTPKKILSVRGPLSRNLLLELGIDCPKIFGDPALLIPKFYNPNDVRKKYKLGIIPHYENKLNSWIKEIQKHEDVKVIDIQQNSIKEFIDDILECENIASSSLHGIIAADAYKIPNCRLIISGMGGFKFNDYHLGVGVKSYNTLNILEKPNTKVHEIIDNCSLKDIRFNQNILIVALKDITQ